MNPAANSTSVFDGLRCSTSGGELHFTLPGRIHPRARAAMVAASQAIDLADVAGDPGGWAAVFRDGDRPALLHAAHFFSALTGATPPPPAAPLPRASKDPRLSVIIVLNENLPFLHHRLVPSLRTTLGDEGYEIIVVWNGTRDPSGILDPAIRIVASRRGAVAAAYNAGAAAARGPLLAFFHDDCIVDDPRWLARTRQRLDDGADVVAAELRRLERVGGIDIPALPVIKSVPMVIPADVFDNAGGFNEWHHAGYEDLDFTLDLLRAGYRVAAADIRVRHFSGMSSTLKYCPVPGLDLLYAATALPRQAIIERFREFTRRGMFHGGHDYLALAIQAQLLHVLERHGALLDGRDPRAFGAARDTIRGQLDAQGITVDAIMQRFRQLDAGYPPARGQT